MTLGEKPDPRRTDGHVTPRYRGAAPECEALHGDLELASSGRRVAVIAARDFPTVSALLGEDACWQFARLFWRDRRPARWHVRRHRAWRAEEPELEQKRQRLIAMSVE